VQVGPENVCGILISQRRLMLLNVKTGELRLLIDVPTEVYVDKGESHEWWHFHTIFPFRKSYNFGYREESNTTVCVKFFSLTQ
jgi:hypothetical protein